MKKTLQVNGALLVGPVVRIGNVETGQSLGVLPANTDRFLALSRTFRIRRHSDGWFVDGRRHRSQIWEYGVGRLGLTVVGSRLINQCLDAQLWLKPKAVGDQEANFHCAWTEENLACLKDLVGLQRRKSVPPSARSGTKMDSL